MKHVTRQGMARATLWLAAALALIGSLEHLAWAFQTLEGDRLFLGRIQMGWVEAVAVDAGLLALTYAVQQWRKARRGVWILFVGVASFCAISVYANLLFGLINATPVDHWLAGLRPVILSAALPLLFVYLAEVVSEEDAYQGANVVAPAVDVVEQVAPEVDVPQVEAQPVVVIEPVVVSLTQPVEQSRNGHGTTRERVALWLQLNPQGTDAEGGRALGISRQMFGNHRKMLEGVAR